MTRANNGSSWWGHMILCIFVSLLSLKYTIYHTKWKFSFKTNLNKSKDQNCKRAHIITKIKLQKARHIIKLLCKKFLILCTFDIDKKKRSISKDQKCMFTAITSTLLQDIENDTWHICQKYNTSKENSVESS